MLHLMIRQSTRLSLIMAIILFLTVTVFNSLTPVFLITTETSSCESDTNASRTFINSQGVLDKSRLFRSHLFSLTGTAWSNLSSGLVCLGTQTSVDKLHWLVELVNQWTGPVSVSVFTPDIDLAVARGYITFIRKCFPSVRERVTFHMSAPADKPGVMIESVKRMDEIPCTEHKKVLTLLLELRSVSMMVWREQLPYPQNLLRNLAKAGCQTNYSYISDIDMLPVPGMDEDLEVFLKAQEEKRDCRKCAYVIPTYEISDKADHAPVNKTELVKLAATGQAREFHVSFHPVNQKSSDLRRWEMEPLGESLGVAYKVEKYIFGYEPLYVAKADTPAFDERFIGFGMTRNTQVYEMFVAGYTFHLLNNAFTSHWGFASLSSRPGWRYKQSARNTYKFPAFAREVSGRYGRDPYNYSTLL